MQNRSSPTCTRKHTAQEQTTFCKVAERVLLRTCVILELKARTRSNQRQIQLTPGTINRTQKTCHRHQEGKTTSTGTETTTHPHTWRYRFSVSLRPWNLSGRGSTLLESMAQLLTYTDSSPLSVLLTLPLAPTMSPASVQAFKFYKTQDIGRRGEGGALSCCLPRGHTAINQSDHPTGHLTYSCLGLLEARHLPRRWGAALYAIDLAMQTFTGGRGNKHAESPYHTHTCLDSSPTCSHITRTEIEPIVNP